jgi:cobalt-zinc-cadmium efflux system protein
LLVLAIVALAGNLLALRLLGHGGGLNIRAASLHVLGDVLGSIGVVGAAICALFFQLYGADPIISLGISFLLIFSASRLLWESINVLLLAVPASLDTRLIEDAIKRMEGVVAVHDLHVWTVASGFVSFSCHVAIDPRYRSQAILTAIGDLLRDEFGIEHATIQVEEAGELAAVHPGCEPCEATVE